MLPKKAAAKSSHKNSKHKWFTNWWCFSFHTLTAEKYVFNGKDAKLIQQLLKQIDLVELVERACTFLTLPESKRFPKGLPTVGGLSHSINSLAGMFNDHVDLQCVEAGLLPVGSCDIEQFTPWENAA